MGQGRLDPNPEQPPTPGRARRLGPRPLSRPAHEVEDRLRQTAEADTPAIPIAVFQDPGQAGKVDVGKPDPKVTALGPLSSDVRLSRFEVDRAGQDGAHASAEAAERGLDHRAVVVGLALPIAGACSAGYTAGDVRRDCERCEVEVEAVYDDPKLRKWVKGYFFLGVPFLPLLPIIGSDFAVMLPMLMVYVIGFGPALGIVREPPKCSECGAAVAHRSPGPRPGA